MSDQPRPLPDHHPSTPHVDPAISPLEERLRGLVSQRGETDTKNVVQLMITAIGMPGAGIASLLRWPNWREVNDKLIDQTWDMLSTTSVEWLVPVVEMIVAHPDKTTDVALYNSLCFAGLYGSMFTVAHEQSLKKKLKPTTFVEAEEVVLTQPEPELHPPTFELGAELSDDDLALSPGVEGAGDSQ